jgi:precorrin-6A/cobalt-precorrin-6A reductase
MKILILGGTAEARELADRLDAMGHAVTTSLAGRTQHPMLPAGAIRMGKFGGVPGLAAYLKAAGIERLVDATHPYAGMISVNAVAASQLSGVPLVRFMRPAWEQPIGANWITVGTAAEAARALPFNADVLLTTGHTGLEHFLQRDDCQFVVRTIEAPAEPLPPRVKLLQARPPYTLQSERELMVREEIDHLVTKNSGGAQTEAKLEAARELGVQVIMIARPIYGPAVEVDTVEGAIEALALQG